MKNKIIGIVNIVMGILSIFISVGLFQSLIKIGQLRTDFGDTSANSFVVYIVLIMIVAMALTNIFFGIKNLDKPKDSEKLFIRGLICVLITFFLNGILVGFLSFSILNPIYNFTTQF